MKTVLSFFKKMSVVMAVCLGFACVNFGAMTVMAGKSLPAYAEEVSEELINGEDTNGNGANSSENDEPEETPEQEEESVTGEITGGLKSEENASEPEPVEENEQGEAESEENAILNAVIEKLKAKYGAEYDEVYNGILEQYGSFKAYVESLIAEGKLDLTEEQADGWREFIKTMDETSVFWVAIIAAVLVVVFAVLAKLGLTKVKELFGKMFKGSNQNSEAIGALVENALSVNNAIAKLLGDGEKTKELREALAASNEALEKEKEELKKDV